MTGWFARLPLQRKLVALALLVSGVALGLAVLGLSLIDLWRHRAMAAEDAQALARIIAENTAASVAFDDREDVAQVLSAIRVREEVAHACVFRSDGVLFGAFSREGGCPAAIPARLPWSRVAGIAPIARNDQAYGTVYVERRLTDLRRRLLLTSVSGGLMLLAVAVTAWLLANRLERTISGPIVGLAAAARRLGDDPAAGIPDIRTAPDEVGDLVSSFREMAGRVRAATTELQRSNAALVRENEERRRLEREREAALQREREASRLKDEFLAAVSHEMRTPLNAIAGWAQVLDASGGDDATRRRAVDAIIRNVRAQTRVVNDLLDTSRSITGRLRLNAEAIDLRQVALDAVEAVQPAAATRRIELRVRTADEACPVTGDRERLQQILWNLLSNAVKFTPSGGRVSVAVMRQPGAVSVEVTDTGPGIAPDFLPYVFDRFRQADGSMTREHGGLGLGLSIAKDLTELHGGTLSAASDGAGRGAVFTLRLPAVSAMTPTGGVVGGASGADRSGGG